MFKRLRDAKPKSNRVFAFKIEEMAPVVMINRDYYYLERKRV